MRELDCRGMRCPMPIFKTAQALKSLEVGGKLLLKSNDPATQPDLIAWSRMTGHQVEVLGNDEFLITN